MKLLLDTHVLLWWLNDNPKLGPIARAHIAGTEAAVWVSVASVWEVAIKFRIGKLAESGSELWDVLREQGFSLLHINQQHLKQVEELPQHHGDPFDHLLIAQAFVEDATIITSDSKFVDYGAPLIAAGR